MKLNQCLLCKKEIWPGSEVVMGYDPALEPTPDNMTYYHRSCLARMQKLKQEKVINDITNLVIQRNYGPR